MNCLMISLITILFFLLRKKEHVKENDTLHTDPDNAKPASPAVLQHILAADKLFFLSHLTFPFFHAIMKERKKNERKDGR